MTNPFTYSDLPMHAENNRTLRRLTMAEDAAGGRGRALRLLGIPDEIIPDTGKTAEALYRKYRTPEAAIAKLERIAMDSRRMAMDAMPGNGHAERLTPEAALRALRSEDEGEALLTAEGSEPLDRDPRLASFRAQMSEADFQSLLRLIRSVRDRYETPDTASDQLSYDTTLHQIASPHDRARYIAFKREMARIAAKSPIAQDAAAREASFLKLFPGATIPTILHY